MLIKNVICIAGIVGLLGSAAAQRTKRRPPAPVIAAPQPAGPEYVDVIEAVVDGQRIDLERVEPKYRAKIKGLGFGGMKTTLEIDGGRSPVRFASGKPVEFVIRVANQDADPVAYVALYRAKANKKVRSMIIAQAGFGGATTTGNGGGNDKIAIAGNKYGSRFYRIKPVALLGPGEYMIKGGNGTTGFMFGID